MFYGFESKMLLIVDLRDMKMPFMVEDLYMKLKFPFEAYRILKWNEYQDYLLPELSTNYKVDPYGVIIFKDDFEKRHTTFSWCISKGEKIVLSAVSKSWANHKPDDHDVSKFKEIMMDVLEQCNEDPSYFDEWHHDKVYHEIVMMLHNLFVIQLRDKYADGRLTTKEQLQEELDWFDKAIENFWGAVSRRV